MLYPDAFIHNSDRIFKYEFKKTEQKFDSNRTSAAAVVASVLFFFLIKFNGLKGLFLSAVARRE